MTQPCDQCSQPSTHPTCDRCLGYQAWASDSGNPRPNAGRLHEQHVEETRRHLTELPDLYALLPTFRLPGSAPKDPDQRSGKANPAWRSVINLDVLDLTDTRLKADAEDTRTDFGVDARAGARRQGVVNTLASWCRLVASELAEEGTDTDLAEEPTISSECGYLLAHLDWIVEQQWFDDELHPDVRKMWADVRRAMGERDKHVDRFVCPTCGNEAVIVAGGWLACTETTEHDVSVRDLEGQYRRKPARSTTDVCKDFGITPERLWQWKSRGILVGTKTVKIIPARREGRSFWWLPWDVFSMLNPDLRAAIDMRDAAEAEAG